MFGKAAAAPIGASTLLERAGSLAVSHGAACYRGCASPLALPTESRRVPQARVKARHRTGGVGCALQEPRGLSSQESSDAAQKSAELVEPHATNQDGAWFDLRLLLAFAKYM